MTAPVGRLAGQAPGDFEALVHRHLRHVDGCWLHEASRPPIAEVRRYVVDTLGWPVADGAQLTATCGSVRCVNPGHLEVR